MSLLKRIAKVVKKGAKVATTINPALGGGFSKMNAMQGQALMSFMPGLPAVPGGAGGSNPLAQLAGMIGTKVGIPSAIGTTVASAFMPQLPTVDEARTYAAWKLAPDSVLQSLNINPDGTPKKRRRMNPLNARAAKRAIRRIKAVRKITAGIERALPKAKARGHWHGHHHHRR